MGRTLVRFQVWKTSTPIIPLSGNWCDVWGMWPLLSRVSTIKAKHTVFVRCINTSVGTQILLSKAIDNGCHGIVEHVLLAILAIRLLIQSLLACELAMLVFMLWIAHLLSCDKITSCPFNRKVSIWSERNVFISSGNAFY